MFSSLCVELDVESTVLVPHRCTAAADVEHGANRLFICQNCRPTKHKNKQQHFMFFNFLYFLYFVID